MTKKIRNIVVIGSGTAAYLVVAGLLNGDYAQEIDITLIESTEVKPMAVGESSTPNLVRHLTCGPFTSFSEICRELRPTFKLGTSYDFSKDGKRYIIPFAHEHLFSASYNLKFPYSWYLDEMEIDGELDATYFLTKYRRAPMLLKEPLIPSFPFGLHCERDKLCAFLDKMIARTCVDRIQGHVVDVRVDDNNFVKEVMLKDGRTIEGDLFFDCTGSRGVLIDKVYGSPKKDISDQLFCDSAWITRHPIKEEPLPVTHASKANAGWIWQIDQTTGHSNRGYVYSSAHISKDEARSELLRRLGEKDAEEPFHVSWESGYREKSWINNVIAIGNSACFIEPMEATAMYLQIMSFGTFARLFEESFLCPSWNEREYFNLHMSEVFAYAVEFIKIHYHFAQGLDTEFWKDIQGVPLTSKTLWWHGNWLRHGSTNTKFRAYHDREVYGAFLWERIFRTRDKYLGPRRVSTHERSRFLSALGRMSAYAQRHTNINEVLDAVGKSNIQMPFHETVQYSEV